MSDGRGEGVGMGEGPSAASSLRGDGELEAHRSSGVGDGGLEALRSGGTGIAPDPAAMDSVQDGAIGAPARAWGLLRGRWGRRAAPVEGGARGLTPDGRLRSGRLAGLGMWGAIWVLSWPVMVESFLNSLVGLTDTALAARLPDGEAATDAIAGASYIMWFVGLIFMALGIGATALISRSIGKGRRAVANAVLGQTVTLGVVVGVAAGVLVAVGSGPVGLLLNMSAGAHGAFTRYLLVIAGGVPFSMVLFALIACARGAGDSVSPLWAMAVRNAVNIGVSWALCGAPIAGVAGPWSLGVTGIAAGTVCGDVAGMLVVLWMALRGTWGIRLVGRRLAPHWHTVRRLVALGVPSFLETLGMWVGNFLVLLMVGWLGVAAGREGLLGSHMVAIRIEAFSFLPGFAMGAAAATLAGQYLGAGAPAMAGRAIARCAVIAGGIMFCFGLAFILVPGALTRAMSAQPVHLEYVPLLLMVAGFVQIPFGLGIVTRGALRGAGDVKAVLVITWCCTYLVRLPLAWLLSGVDVPLPGGGVIVNPSPVEGGLVGLWVGLCADHLVRCAWFGGRFLGGKWKGSRV